MVPDLQKVWTDGRTERTDGQRQNYIPPTSLGDNNQLQVSVVVNTSQSVSIELLLKMKYSHVPVYMCKHHTRICYGYIL